MVKSEELAAGNEPRFSAHVVIRAFCSDQAIRLVNRKILPYRSRQSQGVYT